MVISFEEKDRAAIEEAGRNITKAFAELKRKLMEAWSEAVEPLEELAEALRKALEKVEEHKRLLRRPPKWYAKANNPAMIVSRRRVYHCRDKC